jgi:hypothetical protein
VTCIGDVLYERARAVGGARWGELDDYGKAIWREAERLVSDRLSGNADVTVKFSKQLVERMVDRWGAPVECKLIAQADGTYEMWCRYPGDEIPDEVVRAACEQLYGTDDAKMMNGTREALRTALVAWPPTVAG